MNKHTKIFHSIIPIFILISSIFLFSCKGHSTEKTVNKMLKEDLNCSIEIIKLYYNEEKQGCFVMFETVSYADKAAINLDTGVIEYETEYDYWVEKAEQLRKQNPINENELHKYNQKIINSFYSEWSFSITLFEANGRPEDNEWKRIK